MNQQAILHKAISGKNLTEVESFFFMNSIMKGEVSEIILSSFLTALKLKGETKEEVLGFVKAMRESSIKPDQKFDFDFIDTCGTGGDEKNSINISTLSALNLASMGIKVAKHGNRSVSSLCGSSDFLSAIGFNIQRTKEESAKLLKEQNFAFLFAPIYHPSMKYAVEVRKQLGIRTVFNILGPLCNPFSPNYQIMGVYSKELFEKVAFVFSNLVKAAIVCISKDGFDEFSIFDDTDYLLIDDGKISEHVFQVKDLNLGKINSEEIFCSSKEESIEISLKIASGSDIAGTHAVALNSGAALFLMKKSPTILQGYHDSLKNILLGGIKSYLDNLKNY
jgi:anthranilate phosphoribosyltransferase